MTETKVGALICPKCQEAVSVPEWLSDLLPEWYGPPTKVVLADATAFALVDEHKAKVLAMAEAVRPWCDRLAARCPEHWLERRVGERRKRLAPRRYDYPVGAGVEQDTEGRVNDWMSGPCSACGHTRWDHRSPIRVCALCGCECPDVYGGEGR